MIGSFFFQAEDGIRDLTVTGVQTCALPISVEAVEAPETVEAVEASDAVELVKAPEVPEAETPQAEESGDEDLSGIDADGFKIVDGLRISAPLYNVYLNEADEWSRRLDLKIGRAHV